ncbi:MAG: hypothetical protein QF363_17330 [Planctomycetaceae bacterium]|jgi:hypothetical protein|nr:hypothetical protein [Planctomycetaceae bacterium]
MARSESRREDLLGEATALVRRAELAGESFDPENGPLVAGFRSDGSLSLFLGEDPVYQFNSVGQLRRGFVDGLLYRTQGVTLARLQRDRSSDDRLTLLRHDLSESELASFRETMRRQLGHVLDELLAGKLQQVTAVPETADVAGELSDTLRRVLEVGSWLAPPIAGKD